MSRQAGEGDGERFPPEYQFIVEVVPLGTTSATPAVFIDYDTTSLPAGTYEIVPLMVLSGTNAGTQLESGLFIDAAPLGGPLLETGVPDGTYIFSAPVVAVFGAGVHNVVTTVSKPSGVGTATAVRGQVIVKQVAP